MCLLVRKREPTVNDDKTGYQLRRRRRTARLGAQMILSSESGAATAPFEEAAPSSLVVLLTRHILNDGELVILLLKPSYWFILLQSLRFIAGVLIVIIAAQLYRDNLPTATQFHVFWAGVTAIVARLTWSILQWMGRFYVLTDLRIVRLQGVFNVDIFDCPLRKVARLRRVTTTRERILGLGSIEIIPFDDQLPIGQWQTIARPREVYQEIVKAINRAKQGGMSRD